MAKDKTEKKDKREKKEKRAEKDGVTKSKKDKKEKKDKTALADAVEKELTTQVMDGIDQAVAVEAAEKPEVMEIDGRPVGAVVPFACPLVEDKSAKKVLKTVKKAAVNKCLKRGVKEVVKALRKSPVPAPNAPATTPVGVVVLAADISPMDVISHIPVLCEDHGIPYVFVTSRAELGNSAATKRPTSVTMVTPKPAGKGKKGDSDDSEDFSKVYDELVALAQKEAKKANV